MPSVESNIAALRAWLAEQYDHLDVALSTDPDITDAPLWKVIDSRTVDLLDPHVGTWIRFVHLEADDDVSAQLQQSVRWALEQLAGLEYRSGIGDDFQDPLGAWQVHLIWIFHEGKSVEWEAAIRDLRNRSAHPEELGLDRIIVTSTMEKSLSEDGVPALLLRSRHVLSLTDSEMPDWKSPDLLFERAVREMPTRVLPGLERDFKQAFVDESLSTFTSKQSAAKSAPLPALAKLHIRNFRNIAEADISLPVENPLTVIHGPNGTGKSSLFEALSLALLSSSDRLIQILNDRDLKPNVKAAIAAKVFRQTDSVGEMELFADGIDRLDDIARTADLAEVFVRDGRGTVLAQEKARGFVSLTAEEAASVVLGDYSPVARHVQQAVDISCQRARTEWQNWLRDRGLNASISQRETIITKIAQRSLATSVPQENLSVVTWLDRFYKLSPRVSASISLASSRWANIDGDDARRKLVEGFVKNVSSNRSAVPLLTQWLKERGTVQGELRESFSVAWTNIEPLRTEWERISAELASWSSWMNAPTVASDAPSVVDVAEHVKRQAERAALSERMSTLAAAGKLLSQQEKHLEQLCATLLADWSVQHSDTCPTCASKLPDGVSDVVRKLLESVRENLKEFRVVYAGLQAQHREFQIAATSAGASPIAPERERELAQLLRFIESDESLLRGQIRTRGMALIDEISTLVRSPTLPSILTTEEFEGIAEALCQSVSQQDQEGVMMRELPGRWDSLKKEIDGLALKIVEAHLPNTIESLWHELSLALAPARWNHVGKPTMSMSSVRGTERLGIFLGTDDIPARHILNQAEQHVLGLAWFFTSYLSHGRFRSDLLVLDDPAHEMDQVTYRRFVRFLQSFIRLHRATGHPLRTIIFLHQEDRAIDLARAAAVDGELTVLTWSKEIRTTGSDSTIRTIQLRNPEQRAQLPGRAAKQVKVV